MIVKPLSHITHTLTMIRFCTLWFGRVEEPLTRLLYSTLKTNKEVNITLTSFSIASIIVIVQIHIERGVNHVK